MNSKDCFVSAKAALTVMAMIGALSLASCGKNDEKPQTQAPAAATSPKNPLFAIWALPETSPVPGITERSRLKIEDGKVVFSNTCASNGKSVVAEVTVALVATDKDVKLVEQKNESAALDITGPAVVVPWKFFCDVSSITGDFKYEIKEPKLVITDGAGTQVSYDRVAQ